MKHKLLIISLFITSCLASYQHGLLQAGGHVASNGYDIKGFASIADANSMVWPNIDEQPKGNR